MAAVVLVRRTTAAATSTATATRPTTASTPAATAAATSKDLRRQVDEGSSLVESREGGVELHGSHTPFLSRTEGLGETFAHDTAAADGALIIFRVSYEHDEQRDLPRPKKRPLAPMGVNFLRGSSRSRILMACIAVKTPSMLLRDSGFFEQKRVISWTETTLGSPLRSSAGWTESLKRRRSSISALSGSGTATTSSSWTSQSCEVRDHVPCRSGRRQTC